MAGGQKANARFRISLLAPVRFVASLGNPQEQAATVCTANPALLAVTFSPLPPLQRAEPTLCAPARLHVLPEFFRRSQTGADEITQRGSSVCFVR